MRESIGGTWVFSIVIVFIVIFSGFLAVSVNYSKAFKVKNGIISILEKNEGMSNETEELISDYLDDIGYFVYGTCTNGTNKNSKGYGQSSKNAGKYKFCLTTKETGGSSSTGGATLKKTYYVVTVFFKLDLPVLGSFFTFPVSGETTAIYK